MAPGLEGVWPTASWGLTFPDQVPGGAAPSSAAPSCLSLLMEGDRLGMVLGGSQEPSLRAVDVILGMAAFTPSQHTAIGGL